MRNEIYSKVFLWLFVGLAVTFGTGFFLSMNEVMVENIISSGMYWIVVIAELGIAMFLGFRIKKMNYTTALICYLAYSFITGLTFSLLFLAYKLTSIISVFAITSILFLIFGLYGKYTKRDLSRMSTFLFMGLIGIIVAGIIGIFVQNSMFAATINVISIIIFLGYIAYDMNSIEKIADYVGEDKAAVYCAFQLYLDFINIFIDLLQLIGDSND